MNYGSVEKNLYIELFLLGKMSWVGWRMVYIVLKFVFYGN